HQVYGGIVEQPGTPVAATDGRAYRNQLDPLGGLAIVEFDGAEDFGVESELGIHAASLAAWGVGGVSGGFKSDLCSRNFHLFSYCTELSHDGVSIGSKRPITL